MIRIGKLTFFVVFTAFSVFTAFAQTESPQIIWERGVHFNFSPDASVKFSPDGQFIYTGGRPSLGGDNIAHVEKLAASNGSQISSSLIRYYYSGIFEIAVSPDGSRIISANAPELCDNQQINCGSGFLRYSATDIQEPAQAPVANFANISVDFAPDGQTFVLGGFWYRQSPVNYDNLRIVRTSDLSIVRVLPGHLRRANDGGTYSVRFSPDGTLIASGGADDFVKIWRVSDGALVRSMLFRTNLYPYVASVAFSPDGQYLAALSSDYNSQVKVWRVATGELIHTFQTTSNPDSFTYNSKVTWTRDGRYVVAGAPLQDLPLTRDKVFFWNFQTGALAKEYTLPENLEAHSIEFSPDNRTFAIDGGSRLMLAANPFAANGATFGDFDGDRKTDIAIFRPASAEWWYRRSMDGNSRVSRFGVDGDKIMPGDYTGDGKADLAVWRPATGEWFVVRSEDNSFFALPFGSNGDVPVPADYDGDGKTDPAVFRPSTSLWYIQKSSGGVEILPFGISGDAPAIADYDGDGKADIAITRIDGGNKEWWVRKSSNGQIYALTFGVSADKPVSGDYTGDGKADIAVWRPATGEWFILRSEDSSFYSVPFGTEGDVPTLGDYDGDGKFDWAVYRSSNNVWYRMGSSQGFSAIQFGATGDFPVPTAFVP